MLERHHLADGRLPGGHRHHRPAAAVPAAGRRRRPHGRGGGHAGHPADRARRLHPGQVAAQPQPDDPVRPALGERRSRPTRSRPPTRSSTRRFIGKTVTNAYGTSTFPSDGTIPSDYKMWQPRLGISWDPSGDGKTVVRAERRHLLRPHPRPDLASSRSTNGSRGQTSSAPAPSTASASRRPTYPEPASRRAQIGHARHPDVFVFDQDFQNPRTYSASVGRRARARAEDLALPRPVQLRQGRAHHALPQPQRRRSSARPGRTGLGAGGINGIAGTLDGDGLRRRVDGQEQLPRAHPRPHQALVAQLPVPGQLHAVLGQVGRRQRARPVHLPLRQDRQTSTPSTATRTATSGTASTAFAALAGAGQGQRQPALLVPLGPAAVARRADRRRSRRRPSARPRTASAPTARSSSATPAARTTTFSVARPAALARVRARQARHDRADLRGLQPVQQQEPARAPDHQPDLQLRRHGQSGLGDPRQAQLGARLIW